MRSNLYTTFLLYITPALCQYAINTDLRADVTFGEHNDRFDISNLVQEQRGLEDFLANNRRHRYKQDKAKAEKLDRESDGPDRRSFRLPGKLFARRFDGVFAYHDDMLSDIGGSIDDYDKALKKFRNSDSRRRMDVLRFLHKNPLLMD